MQQLSSTVETSMMVKIIYVASFDVYIGFFIKTIILFHQNVIKLIVFKIFVNVIKFSNVSPVALPLLVFDAFFISLWVAPTVTIIVFCLIEGLNV